MMICHNVPDLDDRTRNDTSRHSPARRNTNRHDRDRQMGQLLRHRRLCRRRPDRITVRRPDAHCREAPDGFGRSRRSIRQPHHRSLRGRFISVGSSCTAPWQTITIAATLWGLLGFGGVVYSVIVFQRMRKQATYIDRFSEDWLFRRRARPRLFACAILALSSFAASSRAHEALFAVGGAALLLLFIGIHNAWDNVAYHVLVNIAGANTERRRDESE